MTNPAVLALDQVSRRFHGVAAVEQLSLEIAPGEFFSLLGPSGCGKTTTLRLIAGFNEPEPDGGTIRMLGEVVNGRRPYQRPIGMVFQHYALFPHLDVFANIAFGLVERHTPRREIADRVDRALELVRLDPATYRRRKPAQLSGGQRQRVALARALVLEPPILLLDEPLGALDLQLRKAMQVELRQLNRALGVTFILVTHDQEEALTMSDRVAVMSAGRIVQVGTPRDIYQHPRSAFVATFIGEANVLAGVVDRVEDGAVVVCQSGQSWRVAAQGNVRGDRVEIAVRPEWMQLARPGTETAGTNSLPARLRELVFLGETVHALAELGNGRDVRVALGRQSRDGGYAFAPGDDVVVTWRIDDAQVLDP